MNCCDQASCDCYHSIDCCHSSDCCYSNCFNICDWKCLIPILTVIVILIVLLVIFLILAIRNSKKKVNRELYEHFYKFVKECDCNDLEFSYKDDKLSIVIEKKDNCIKKADMTYKKNHERLK